MIPLLPIKSKLKKVVNGSGPWLRKFSKNTWSTLRSKKFWIFIGSLIFSGILFIAVLYILILNDVFGHLPTKSELRNITQDEASEVYSADNVLMGRYYIENRVNLALDSVPRYVVNALIATEDVRFFDHNGVDFRSLLRVGIKTILLGKEESGGGSTITQQLAKNLFPRKDFGFFSLPINKAREHLISLRLEKVYSKEEILSFYLNTVSFGEDTYGLETASKRFFNIHPAALSLEEAAVLIGLLKGPALYNPRTNYENAIERRNFVLSQLDKYDFYDSEIIDSLKERPIETNYSRYTASSGLAPYFSEVIRVKALKILERIEEESGSTYNLYTGGLRINATIDSRLQAFAEKALKEKMKELQKSLEEHYHGNYPWSDEIEIIQHLVQQSDYYKYLQNHDLTESQIDSAFRDTIETNVFSWDGYVERRMTRIDSIKYYLNFLHSGFMAMDHQNGAILAWVGGINFKEFQYDHVLSKRQAGSTFKPILYATAIENEFSPCQFISNDSIVFTDYDNWKPRNSERQYGGWYSLKGALVHSVNTVSARLILETGIDKVINTAYDLGIQNKLEEVPSLALGSGEVSLFEMVRAYSSFVNEGRIIEPRYIQSIEDSEGNVIFENDSLNYGPQAFSRETSEKMLQMLRLVVNNGTGAGIRSRFGIYSDLAGKTGTTQNQSDGWFIAITPRMIAGAWVGGEIPVVRFRTLNLGQGSATALPIVADFLKSSYAVPKFKSWSEEKFEFQYVKDLDELFDCPDFEENRYRRKIFRILDIFRRKDKR